MLSSGAFCVVAQRKNNRNNSGSVDGADGGGAGLSSRVVGGEDWNWIRRLRIEVVANVAVVEGGRCSCTSHLA